MDQGIWKSKEEKYGKDIVEESMISQQQSWEMYQPGVWIACMYPGYKTCDGNFSETGIEMHECGYVDVGKLNEWCGTAY